MSKKVKRAEEARRSSKTSETTLEQIMETFTPKKKTSKQEKASDEVEDKREKAATKDPITVNNAPHLFNDEPPESTGSDSAKQGEEVLTNSHGDAMLETMEQRLTAQCDQIKAIRFELMQLVAANGDPTKIN